MTGIAVATGIALTHSLQCCYLHNPHIASIIAREVSRSPAGKTADPTFKTFVTLFRGYQQLQLSALNRSQVSENVARFIGLSEGITLCEPPQFWKSAIKESKDMRTFVAPLPGIFHELKSGVLVYRNEFVNTAIKSNVPIEGTKLTMPGLVDSAYSQFDDLSLTRCSIDCRNNIVAIALFSDVATSYELRCYKLNDSKHQLLWAQKIWAGNRRLATGNHNHAASVSLSGSDVVVFGIDSHSIYIETFDVEKGSPKVRFNSDYWGYVSK